MRSFIINENLQTIRKSREFKKFDEDLRGSGPYHFPKLDHYTENYFVRRIQLYDDVNAMVELIKANFGFIIAVAKQMCTQYVLIDDLINEGIIGFIKSVYKFKKEKEVKLMSYAVWWIRSEISNSITSFNELIHESSYNPLLRAKINSVIDLLYNETGEDYSTRYGELADILDFSVDKVVYLLNAPLRAKILSFDSSYPDDASIYISGEDLYKIEEIYEFSDIISTYDDGLLKESLRIEIQRSLNTLTDLQQDMIILYFGLNINLKNESLTANTSKEHSYSDIGDYFNLTRERVGQIINQSIRRLRHTSRSAHLKTYLG